jgi:hypothetical protein
MTYLFSEKKMETAGAYVLREGDPVTHVAFIKNGEFDVVKKNLRGMDDRIMGFLKKADLRKTVAKRVLMLRGRTSIYQKTSQLIPSQEKTTENSFLNDKSIDIEQLAFDSVSDKLLEIARQQEENSKKGVQTSLNAIKTSKIDKYKDIRVTIIGKGFCLGDYETITN